MKRLLATLLMTLTLFCVISTAAFAANQAKIVITNNDTTTGISLAGKEFDVYKIFNATVSGTTISYEIVDQYKKFFVEDLSVGGSVNSFGETAAEGYINNLGTTAKKQEFAAKLQEFVTKASNSINADSTINGEYSDSEGVQKMESDSLDYGYYLVLDASTNGSTKSSAMLVTLPKDSEGSFAGDVNITMKGSQPDIDKEIWHNDKHGGSWDNVGDYAIGDTVKFRIAADIPSDMRGYTSYTYKITDTWSDGLTFVEDSIKIYKDPELEDAVKGEKHDTDIDEANNTFTLDFKMLDIKAALPELNKFYVYYECVISDDVDTALDYETNTVELKFSNDPFNKESFGTAKDTVYSYTFELDAIKTNSSGTGLADAFFELWIDPSNEQDKAEKVYLNDAGNNVYTVGKGTVTQEKDGKGVITSITGGIKTDSTGKFIIKGLDDDTTYILKEVQAPGGYTAGEDISFKITADYGSGTTPTVSSSNSDVIVNNGKLSTTVINTSSVLFPGTGGVGTTIFMIAGCAIMAAAAFMLISSRKKQS